MLLNTAVFGEIDVEPGDVFHFPDGLYGFEGAGDYALITKEDEDVTLMWLQSTQSTAPCFVVFDPFNVAEGYAPKVENSDLRHLEAKDESELSFFVIAVVPDDISQISVNLKSPVVVNKKTRVARQVILANQDYPIKYFLFGEFGEEPEQA